MQLFKDLFSTHHELIDIFTIVWLYHILSSALIHTLCGFIAAIAVSPDIGKYAVSAIVVFPALALLTVVTYGAFTSYLIAQVFVSSDQVMQHWIAIVIGVGQTVVQIILGRAWLD